MDKEYYLAIGFLLVTMLFIGWRWGFSERNPTQFYGFPQNVEFKNELTGINTEFLTLGNYSYQFMLTNPYNNASVRVYSFLFSEPENAGAVLSCNIANGTLVLPLESVYVRCDLEVFEVAEYYIRVGCLVEGVDY